MNPESWTTTLIFTIRLFFRLFIEKLLSIFKYWYQYDLFWVEIGLFWQYPILSPQYANRRFIKERNLTHAYLFGETSLSALATIVDELNLPSGKVVFDVGCGWGKSTFFLHKYTKAHRTIGIDIQPDYIIKAEKIRVWLKRDYMVFLEADIRKIDYCDADVIYLYGTCLGEEVILTLAQIWEKQLQTGTIIITTSFALTSYTKNQKIELTKCVSIRYLWGLCNVYFHKVL
jgi:precorrin-6B methylase 2